MILGEMDYKKTEIQEYFDQSFNHETPTAIYDWVSLGFDHLSSSQCIRYFTNTSAGIFIYCYAYFS